MSQEDMRLDKCKYFNLNNTNKKQESISHQKKTCSDDNDSLITCCVFNNSNPVLYHGVTLKTVSRHLFVA